MPYSLFCHQGHQLPALFLLGMQKCGTSSLTYQLQYEWNVTSGNMSLSDGSTEARKETHFFDRTHEIMLAGAGMWSLAEFAAHFPSCGEYVLTFDGTPNYLFRELSIAKIKKAYGAARLAKTTFAAIVCDPAQRAQSYNNHFNPGVSFRSIANESKFGDAFANGLYGSLIDRVLEEIGHITIIPAPIYYTDADLVIGELLDIVRLRSGQSPPATAAAKHKSSPPHIHERPHPTLADDYNPSDGPRIARYFERSNARAYTLVYGSDPRVTVVPARHNWPASAPEHFLETSAILTPHLKPFPWVPPFPALSNSTVRA